MNVDGERVLERLQALLPREVRDELLLVGSLAAVVHFARDLGDRVLVTKDADFIIQSASDIGRAVEIAELLRKTGWRIRNESGFPPGKAPDGELPHVKLYSPMETEFWIEFQGLPGADQADPRKDVPVRFAEGWYALPCYRFMGLANHETQVSSGGLRYAAPRMMALANLLAHSRIGDARVTLSTGRKGGLRSAKDLGRAVALARLAPLAEVRTWATSWLPALQACFPATWREHAGTADRGLNELLGSPLAVDEAIGFAAALGLLDGANATPVAFRAMADQLRLTAIRALQEAAISG